MTQLANGKSAIVPSVAGRAWITGTHQHMIDPKGPLAHWISSFRYVADADRLIVKPIVTPNSRPKNQSGEFIK